MKAILLAVASLVAVCSASTATMASTNNKPSSTQETTSMEPTTEIDCGPLPWIEHVSIVAPCTGTTPGSTCEGQCGPGYEAPTQLLFTCTSYGLWELPDGTPITGAASSQSRSADGSSTMQSTTADAMSGDGVCTDLDACKANPCDGKVSQCVDEPAPSLGHQCECLPGFFGTPGADGSGCSRTAIKTEEGNAVFTTGQDKDVHFKLGNTIHTSIRSILDEIQVSRDTEQSLEQRIDTTDDSLSLARQQLEQSIDDEAAARRSDVNSLETSISEEKADVLGRLASSIASTSDTLSTRIKQTQDSVEAERVRAIGKENSLDAYVDSVSNRVGSAETRIGGLSNVVRSQGNSITSLSSALSSETLRAVGKENALTSSINSLDTRVNTVNGRFNDYYTKSQTYTQSQVQSMVNGVANARYTKSEVDAKFSALGNTYYTKAQVSTEVSRGVSRAISTTQSWTNRYFDQKSSVDSKINSVKSWANSQFYTQSYLNSRMVYPVNAGASRRIPLQLTTFMQNDDHSYYNAAIYDYSSYLRLIVTYSYLELYASLNVPQGWYLSYFYLYGSDTYNDMYVYATTISSGYKYHICSSGYINRGMNCNSSSRQAPSYQIMAYIYLSTGDYIYGGYYDIRKL